MQNLATIEKILWIKEIENSDNIELCGIKGWCVVVKKNEFKVGDLCVYVQIDTVMPELPEYEFLRSRKFRVRSIKIRGVLSQGLILPLSVLKNYGKLEYINEKYYFYKF